MSREAGSGTYPLATFASATVSTQPSPIRRIAIRSVAGAVLRGLDCAIYSVAALVFFVFGVLFIIAEPQAVAFGLLSLAAGFVSGGLVAARIVVVYRALRLGEAVEAEIVGSAVGLVRLTGTLWGDLINGTAVRGSYRISGEESVVDYYLQERWARSLKPGMKIWVISVNGRPALLAPRVQFDG
jgi:hypothetical protein